MAVQLHLSLIPHQVENQIVPQRTSDGYINATAMCDAVGKLFADYRRLKTTQSFLDELESDMGIPITDLVVSIQGGLPSEQGTWVHPDIAIHLGQWCSPKFAVAVSRWVRDWHAGRSKQSLPYHLRRYQANALKVPHTHFSMLNELTLHVIAPLEFHGYTLPSNLVPDVSTGRMFSGWLRKNLSIEPKNFPTYDHEYENGKIVSGVRLYPVEHLPAFRGYLHKVWIPSRMIPYFKEKDPNALGYLPRAFPALYGHPPVSSIIPKHKQVNRRRSG